MKAKLIYLAQALSQSNNCDLIKRRFIFCSPVKSSACFCLNSISGIVNLTGCEKMGRRSRLRSIAVTVHEMGLHDRTVYQEEHAAQLILARKLSSPYKGRTHLRRPVDQPLTFPSMLLSFERVGLASVRSGI